MHFDTIDQMFQQALQDCWFSGHKINSRDGGCSEVLGWEGTLDYPKQCFLWNQERRFNPSYAAGELLWYLAETNSGDHIKHYAPSYDRFLEDDGNANGAYGARWAEHGGLQCLVQLLEQDPNTRQGILAMWGPRDLPSAHAHNKRDIPCTLSIQYFVRRNRLYCVCTMRSNDVWLGLPNDVFAFAQLQCLIADYLGLKVGWYRHQVGSMHLYDRNSKKAVKAVEWKVGTGMTPVIQRPQTFGSAVFAAAIQDALFIEKTARLGDVDKLARFVELMPRTRFTVIATLAACTSYRKQDTEMPIFQDILGRDTMKACRC